MQGSVNTLSLSELPSFVIGGRFLREFRGIPFRARTFRGLIGHFLLSYGYPFSHIVYPMVIKGDRECLGRTLQS